jgi:hypothetical protein
VRNCKPLKRKNKRRKKSKKKKKKKIKTLYENCSFMDICLGDRKFDLPIADKGSIYFDKKNVIHTPVVIYYPEFA